MFKKMLVLLVPVVALAALTIAPLSASADVSWKCPKGVTNHKYCTKIIQCKVPQLKGKSPGQAGTLLRQHDCGLGKTTKASGSGVPKGKVLRSSPGAGSVRGNGFKVNIVVRK